MNHNTLLLLGYHKRRSYHVGHSVCKPVIVILAVILPAARPDTARRQRMVRRDGWQGRESGHKRFLLGPCLGVSGRQKVRPGDTLWISEGTYRHPDRRRGLSR